MLQVIKKNSKAAENILSFIFLPFFLSRIAPKNPHRLYKVGQRVQLE